MSTGNAAGVRIAGFLLFLFAATAIAQVQPIPERKVDVPVALPPIQPGQLQLQRPNPVTRPIELPKPPRVSINYAQDATSLQHEMYQGRPVLLRLEFANLPVGRVSVFPDPDHHPLQSIRLVENSDGRTPISNTTRSVNPDGTLAFTAHVIFNMGPTLPATGSPLHLRVKYNDGSHPPLAVRTPPLRIKGMKLHAASFPANIRNLVDLGGWQYLTGARDSLFGCGGPRDDVGVFVDGGKLRIRTRSGPLGSYCARETHRPVFLRYPWRATEIRFGSSSSDTTRCWVQSPLRPMYLSGRGEDAISMIPGRVALGEGKEGVNLLPTMVGVTQCTNTLFDDQFVELRWEGIELLGPVDGNPADAWP
jgi:hypothetical protein